MERGLSLWCGAMLVSACLPAGSIRAAAPTKEAVSQAVDAYIKTADREFMKSNREHASAKKTVVADLNGDGKSEIVLWVLLLGPTYWNNYVAVFADGGAGYKVVAKSRQGLGQVEDINVRDGLVDVHTKMPAKGDALCCPTLSRVIRFKWENSQLVEAHGSRGEPRGKKPASPGASKAKSAGGWEIRPVPGRPPVATVKGPGVVQSLSLMCDQGRAVAALVVVAKPPPGPVSFSMSVAGHRTSVPLVRATAGGKLLMGDLSRSALPRLLAAHDRGWAELRINGGVQGKLALAGAAKASRSALQSCYRY